ncbi:MAG TPA: hypothetical protein PLJ65_11430, partial [Casimicrobium sp.]|nr:hypothetical protein [Casimicrobium sp.]
MSRELDVVTLTGEEYDEMQNEIERLTDLNRVLEAGFMEAVKQIAKSDPVGVSRWLKEQGVTTPNALAQADAACGVSPGAMG